MKGRIWTRKSAKYLKKSKCSIAEQIHSSEIDIAMRPAYAMSSTIGFEHLDRKKRRKEKIMDTSKVHVSGNVFSRILLFFGLYTLLFNAAFLIGYYWLPEGILRATPATAAGQVVATAQTFWGQLGFTLLFNLGSILVASISMNLFQIKGVSLGILLPFFLAVFSGLVTGTNSFVSSDMTQYNVRDGTALALSIQTFEMLGYLFIVSATVGLGIFQYRSLWQWKPTKVIKLRDIKLSKPEMMCVVIGILLIIFGAFRETMLSFNML
jgi:hypothetical protein